MLARKLLKWKLERDCPNLKTQQLRVEIRQLGVDLYAFGLELQMKRKVEQPIVSIEETHTHEHNEVNFDHPPKLDEYEEHKIDTTEEDKIQEEEKEEKESIKELVTPP